MSNDNVAMSDNNTNMQFAVALVASAYIAVRGDGEGLPADLAFTGIIFDVDFADVRLLAKQALKDEKSFIKAEAIVEMAEKDLWGTLDWALAEIDRISEMFDNKNALVDGVAA